MQLYVFDFDAETIQKNRRNKQQSPLQQWALYLPMIIFQIQ